MKTFRVYKHPTQGLEAVKIGFSWPALFFCLLWMLSKKLWALFFLWLGAWVVCSVVDAAASSSGQMVQAFAYSLLTVAGLFLWLFPAFKGNGWREKNLLNRGYELLGKVQTETVEAAVALLTSRTPVRPGEEEGPDDRKAVRSSRPYGTSEKDVSAKKDEMSRLVMQMGFDHDQANQMMESLLKQLTGKGYLIDRAMDAIEADIRSEGKLFHKLQALREKESASSGTSSALEENCPKCGTPRPRGAAGKFAEECPNCGVIFKKIRQTGKHLEPEVLAPSNSPAAEFKGALLSTGGSFISRHKVISSVSALLIVLFVVGLLTQMYYRSEHRKLVKTFDQHLKMDTKEEYETSLENLQFLIEYTAFLVSRRGWTTGALDGMCNDVDKRITLFTQTMEKAASGQKTLFGYELGNVRESLCGGMKIVLSSIRDKKAQKKVISYFQLRQAVQHGLVNFSCEMGKYKTSSKKEIVREGNGYVLKARSKPSTSTESSEPPIKTTKVLNPKLTGQSGRPNPELPPSYEPPKKAAPNFMQSFYLARRELLAMQEEYRRRHNTWCENDRELLKEFKATGVPITEITAEMIEKGLIFSKIQDQSITVEYNPDAHVP